MKIKFCHWLTVIALFTLSTLNSQLSTACAQGTAFTYQGRLISGGAPANGSYDIAFTLFATNTTGVAIAGPVTNAAVAVTNSLFTTLVDFGGVFTGGSNWLQIAVSTNSANTFTNLTPRQQITPTPYALYAPNAGSAATATSANSVAAANITGSLSTGQLPVGVLTNGASGVNLSGAFSGNGSGLTGLNAAQLNGTISSANLPYGLGGNGNTAGAGSAVVAGGIFNNAGSGAAVSGGSQNTASGSTSVVSGGTQNTAGGNYSVVAGGQQNTASGPDATVAGGNQNFATNNYAAVSGGVNNTAGGYAAAVMGGDNNFALGSVSTVSGDHNTASGADSFAAGHLANATNDGSFVWADSQGPSFYSLNNNSFNVQAHGGARFVTGGAGLTVDGPVSGTSFSGTFTGNGANVTNVNAATLGGIGSAGFWKTNGNTGANPTNGAYLGTADNYPLELHVNGQRGLRLEFVTNSIDGQSINVIGGSFLNLVSNSVVGATIGGGGNASLPNQVLADFGTIGGGLFNKASGIYATVAGGDLNTASGLNSSVVGGQNNTASGLDSFAAGNLANATNDGAFVWADSQGPSFYSTNNNSFNVQAHGGARFVTGGAGLTLDGPVSGTSFSGGGSGLTSLPAGNLTGPLPTISGANLTSLNASQLTSGTVPVAQLPAIVVTNTETGVTLNGTFSGSGSALTSLNATQLNGTISSANLPNGLGGSVNTAGGSGAVVSGGQQNTASGDYAVVAGGDQNTASGPTAMVVGGYQNFATNNYATVGGGVNNTAGGYSAMVIGGDNNYALGTSSTVSGDHNTATGLYTFAAGHLANATNDGAFVWADSQGPSFYSTNNNSFNVQAHGGVRFVTGGKGMTIDGPVTANGVLLTSDRNAKENFTDINAQTVLARVSALPITEWSYKTDSQGVRHLGPMAQDFQAAFGLDGADDKHISMIDEGGVALAAIQGLNQKLEEKDARINELEARLEKLEQMMNAKTGEVK